MAAWTRMISGSRCLSTRKMMSTMARWESMMMKSLCSRSDLKYVRTKEPLLRRLLQPLLKHNQFNHLKSMAVLWPKLRRPLQWLKCQPVIVMVGLRPEQLVKWLEKELSSSKRQSLQPQRRIDTREAILKAAWMQVIVCIARQRNQTQEQEQLPKSINLQQVPSLVVIADSQIQPKKPRLSSSLMALLNNSRWHQAANLGSSRIPLAAVLALVARISRL